MTGLFAVTGVVLAALFTLASLARRRLMVVRVEGDSMLPALRDADLRLAWRIFPGRPGLQQLRHQVVVFRLLEHQRFEELSHLVKRVAAVEGDPVPPQVRHALALDPGATVPQGHVAVLGDHPRSQDSRHLGFIAAGQLVGVVRGV
ncbi:MAG: S26 family signal peptidase [Archangiaceae bacterium]|nr:S26 family signal peptidase [Archangiaceae bacterium]